MVEGKPTLPMPLAISRQETILADLATLGELHVNNLAHKFSVSVETIRRDLKLLEERRMLRRVHGGAVQPARLESYEHRKAVNLGSKERIAEAVIASKTVKDGHLIFVGGGSTMLAFVRCLNEAVSVRAVTNSIEIATALAENSRNWVCLTGGEVSGTHELLTGTATLAAIEDVFFDIVLTSTNAIQSDFGCIEHLEEEAKLHRILRSRTKKYVVLADRSKLAGMGTGHRSLRLDEIDLIATDAPMTEPCAEVFATIGTQIILS